MFAKTRKEKFVEQAQGLANDLSEAVTPHVERARDELAPRIADVRNQAAPHVEQLRDRIATDVVPKVQQVVNDAREQAGPVAEEARRRGTLAAAALKGEQEVQKKKGGKKRKVLFLALLAGVGAFVGKKLTAGDSSNWQSSYTPSPAPAAPPAPPSPAAPMAGSHVADVPADHSTTGADSGDAAGAAPGESLSDAVEEPHPVTTPDNPVEKSDVSDVKDPKA